MRTLLVMTTGEGCRWGDTAQYGDVLVPEDGESLDEGLPVDNRNESDGTAGGAVAVTKAVQLPMRIRPPSRCGWRH